MKLEFEPNVTAIPLVKKELFEEIAISGSTHFRTVLMHGISAAQKGEREAARMLLTQASEIDPHSEDAWMWLASISEYPEELLAFLNNVLNINPANERAIEWHSATRSLLAKTFVQRGIAAHNQGSDELAMQYFDQALLSDDACEIAWLWRAGISSSDEEKIECLRQVLQLNPNNEEAQRAMGSITKAATRVALEEAKKAAVAGKLKKAITIIDRVVKDEPDDADAWMLKSHLSVDLKDKLVSLERVLEIDPENAMARSSFEFLTATVERAVPTVAVSHLADLPTSEQTQYEPLNLDIEEATEPAQDLQPLIPVAVTQTQEDERERHELQREVVYVIKDIADGPDEIDITDDPLVSMPPGSPTAVLADGIGCSYCGAQNESQVFECNSCHAVWTLSDIEALLSNPRADCDLIQNSVAEMEADWNLREFDERELTVLAIGHFNLRNFDRGFKYLQEASRLDPNNVILSGQINAIAIRLEEMRRQDEVQDTMPKGLSILVVDDSPTVRKLIAGKLKKSGHNVVCAVDGVEGLARIAEVLPDLVLLDIGMPRMDGYEVCREIRSNPAAKDLPVVMISGKDGFFDKVRGRMAGATGYVTKPFGPETLMKALETYLVPEPDSGQ